MTKSDILYTVPQTNQEKEFIEGGNGGTICKVDLTIYKNGRSEASIKRELKEWEAIRKSSHFVLSVKFI